MDDPYITIDECIRLEEEKARRRGKVFNWETAKYGRILYDEDVHGLISIENEFPAIAFNDSLTSGETLSCEPTVSSLNDEIDFKISFDDFNDEDYTVIFDKNSFSYEIISVNNLKTDSENDNKKVNMHSFLPPEPTVSCFDDLDFFKDFENEFSAIFYNDAPTSKSDLLTELILSPQHIDEFDLNDEISLSEYDEEEQNVLYFNDLFPFNIIHTNDLMSKKDNDDNEIDIIQSSGDVAPLPPRDQRHLWLRYQVEGYTEDIDLAERMMMVYTRADGTNMIGDKMGLDVARTLCFQLRGRIWSILGRERLVPDKGNLSDYWVEISFGRDFLRGTPSYTYIRDPVWRRAEGRKSGAMLFRGHFIGRLAHHFGLVSDDRLRGLSVVAHELSLIDMGELAPQQPSPPPPDAGRTMPQRLGRLEEEVQELQQDVRTLRGLVE
ncbi:hypothetical protein Tco_0668746 [Tanacetum coccineum]